MGWKLVCLGTTWLACLVVVLGRPGFGQEWYDPNPVAPDDPFASLSDQQLIDLYISSLPPSQQASVFDSASLIDNSLAIQLGYTYSYDRDDSEFRTDQHTIPELLVRYRVLERVELRIAWAGVTLDTLTDETSNESDQDTRTATPSFGARFALTTQRAWLPRTSLTLATPFDLESDTNLVDRVDPLVSLGYSWLFAESWLLAGSSAGVWTLDSGERYFDFQQSVSAFYFLNDRWDVSLTWSGLFPEGSRIDGMNHTIGPGISHRLTDRLQLDLITAFGIDDLSPDMLVQTVVTWRQ